MNDIDIASPPLLLIRISIAAVWLYEGLWCKVVGRMPSQAEIVAAVPRLGPRFGAVFLKLLGLVEIGLALWVLSGVTPAACAIAQAVLLITLNVNGLIWARRKIHDPAGMVVKNAAFLVLVWIAGAIPQSKP
jgi:uncharacterized membrane protein YphA (DoxX/SURF4 family)